MTKKRGAPPPACEPAEYDEYDIRAIQSLATGTASDSQQKRALDWIINKGCGAYELSYRPGDSHETAFAEGRRFGGLQIVKLLKVKIQPKEIA